MRNELAAQNQSSPPTPLPIMKNNNWITIEPKDVETYLVKTQLKILTTHKALCEENLLETIIEDVTNAIRLKVDPENETEEGTIPPGLKMQACVLIIEALQSRLPDFVLSKDQANNVKNAWKFIDECAKQNKKPTKTSPGYGAIKVVKSRKNDVSGSKLKGF
jgi:hypothetical protein